MTKGDHILTSLRAASTIAATATIQTANRSPLAPLPYSNLIRSLFIAGISSKRLLLLPSLKILSFLSKPERSVIFNVDKNPLVHAILKKTFYNQFCAGETGADTRQCVRNLKDLGFKGVILTYARETVFDHKTNTTDVQGVTSEEGALLSEHSFCQHIDDWRTGTLETMELVDKDDFLAVKYVTMCPCVWDTY